MRAATRFQTSLDRLMAHADRDVRLQAARCVGRLTGPAVLARLRDLAADADPLVRREALRTLAAKAPKAGRTTLREAFNEETDLECRRAALAGLVAIRDDGIRPALRRLIRNPDAFIYEQSPASQASRQALCCEAVQALAVVGDASAVPDLLGLLDRHVSPSLDDAVIRTLAELGDSGREAIGRLVREAPVHRARSAVEALAGCADAGQTDALAMFLCHDDEGVRLAAAGSLARLAPCHSALLRRAHDPSPAVRALVAQHAGPTMPSILELLLDDAEAEVASAALGALARLPDAARAADVLWRVRGKLRSNNPTIGCRAAETLAAIDPAAARIDLGERLADPNAPVAVRVAAARILSQTGGSGAVPALAAQLFAPEEELRRGVLDALTTLARDHGATPAVLPLFLGVLTHGPESRRRAGLAADHAVASERAPLKAFEAAPEHVAGIRRDIAARVSDIADADVARALAAIVLATADAELRTAAARSLAQVAETLEAAPEPAI
ncbi:MAG: HEAT repeat domain-containing protein, partial [Alphaproteobacteria bacterium]